MIDALRTPDERFAGLPGWSHEPRYEVLPECGGLRMHYVDEGDPSAAEIFLCLHGQPTWSYLYRKMIPVYAAAGKRVIALDLFGFGRSDKPVDEEIYTFDFHRRGLVAFVEALDLTAITLVIQDWGGILGLTLPMEMPERIRRLVLMNTGLTTGEAPLPPAFLAWRQWSSDHPDMKIAGLMSRACPHLTPEECAAYEAPYPDVTYKGGVRRFPQLVPEHRDDPGAEVSRRARDWLRDEWSGESFMAIGMQDEILGPPAMHALRRAVRGCPEPYEIAKAGHFVQEWGEEVARRSLEAFSP